MRYKYIIFILLLMFIPMLIYGCVSLKTSPPENISGYDYAEYDDFTSHSIGEEGDKIYIQGTLQKSYVQEYDGAPFIVVDILEAKNKKWIYRIGPMGLYSDEMISDHIGEDVRCFGSFYKMVDDQPVVDSEWDYSLNHVSACMQFYKSSEDIEKLKDFLSSDKYISSYVDRNAEELLYYDDEKEPGTFKSTGIFDAISDDKEYSYFYFYEETQGGYQSSLIDHELSDTYLSAIRCNEVIDTILDLYSTGDCITLFYTVDEKGHAYLFGCEKANGTKNIDEIRDDASPYKTAVEKEYVLGEYGTISFKLNIRKSDTKVIIIINADVNTAEDAVNLFMVILGMYEDEDINYGMNISINNTEAYVVYTNIDGEQNLSGLELDGSYGFSWLQSTDGSEEGYKKMSEVLTPIYGDFLEEVEKVIE